MAAKAWGSAQQKAVEEIFFNNDAVSLCMMVNRRAKTMRVIDFRAGPTHAKRLFVLSMAQREGIEKVYTLVERDEVGTWVKLGFAREGNIPGFYKRSDAFLLGCDISDTETQRRSEIRIALGQQDDDLDDDGPGEKDKATSPAHQRAEKTLVTAKKRAKELVGKATPPAKVAVLAEAEAKKAVAAAVKLGRAMTGFEPFGRDVERRYYAVTARGSYELVASTEAQTCFGNAFLELLTAPKNDPERIVVVGALRALCDRMLADGVVSCFCLAPSDDVALATAFVANGFRRTGLLVNHLQVGADRKDAILWSRKLATPADE